MNFFVRTVTDESLMLAPRSGRRPEVTEGHPGSGRHGAEASLRLTLRACTSHVAEWRDAAADAELEEAELAPEPEP